MSRDGQGRRSARRVSPFAAAPAAVTDRPEPHPYQVSMMKYVEGFVLAVPKANKEQYLQHAGQALPIFKEMGISRVVECWGDDVPDGKVTDFRRAVQAAPDEEVVFSWFEYSSKEVRDAVYQKMMDDPRMQAMSKNMPFDGKRMIFGGFVPILDA